MIQLQVRLSNLPTWVTYVKLTWTDTAGQEYLLYPYKPPGSPSVPQISSHYLHKGYRFTCNVPERGYLTLSVITSYRETLLGERQPGLTTVFDTTGIGRTILDWDFDTNIIKDDSRTYYISQPVIIAGALPLPPIFGPGTIHSARAPMTNPATRSIDYVAELYLGVLKSASSGGIPFSLGPNETKVVSFSMTMPGTGRYPVFLDVISNGLLIGTYQAEEDVRVSSNPQGYY